MWFLFGPTFRLVFSSADLRSLDITILDKGGPADLGSLVEGDLLVLDETALPEVLLTLLLLLGLVLGHVGGVTPPVVGVVALDDVVVLDLLDHFDLVDTSLAVSTRSSSSNSGEAHISVVSLTLGTSLKGLDGLAFMVFSMVAMVFVMSSMVFSMALLGVEGEGSEKVLSLSPVPAQLAGPQGTAGKKAQRERQLRENNFVYFGLK